MMRSAWSVWVRVALCAALAVGAMTLVAESVCAQQWQTQVVEKRCGRCGKRVALSSHVGQRCPHCGAYWGGEVRRYMCQSCGRTLPASYRSGRPCPYCKGSAHRIVVAGGGGDDAPAPRSPRVRMPSAASFDQPMETYQGGIPPYDSEGYETYGPEGSETYDPGEPATSDPGGPYLSGVRLMVPMREVFEWLGARVEYDELTQTITAVHGETQVQLRPGDAQATVNGEAVSLDAPAQLMGGCTYVPLRFVAEAMGAEVAWDPYTNTASISHEGREKTYTVGSADEAEEDWGL